MSRARSLTSANQAGIMATIDGSADAAVALPPICSAMSSIVLEDARDRRAARLAATLSPQAALVLPFMLTLARIQARRDHVEVSR